MDEMFCGVCGVEVSQSKTGRWVHVNELPPGIEYHDVPPVSLAEFEAAKKASVNQERTRAAIVWASEVRDKMLGPDMEGVQWTAPVRHAVALLEALEVAGLA